MAHCFAIALLLAAEEAAPAKPAPANPLTELLSFAPFIAIFLLFIFMMRGNKREKATREAMLESLKKNDKVLTVGGIIGTVANVSSDGQEVTLKVDDNTRIRVIKSAIQRVMTAEGEAEQPAATK